jgi:hypothetical protein
LTYFGGFKVLTFLVIESYIFSDVTDMWALDFNRLHSVMFQKAEFSIFYTLDIIISSDVGTE